jgi:hypothetical protein
MIPETSVQQEGWAGVTGREKPRWNANRMGRQGSRKLAEGL